MKYLLPLLFIIFCHNKEKEEAVVPEQKCYVLEQGDNLEIALKNLGIEYEKRAKLITSAQEGGFPIRRCMVGDTIVATFTQDTLIDIIYDIDPKTSYILTDDCLAMQYHNIEYRAELVQGKINSSLYESMLKIGETPDLVVDFASIFAWEIDFFTETRSKDSFVILLKREYVDSISTGYSHIHYLHYGGEIGSFAAYRYIDPTGKIGYYTKEGRSLKKLFLKAPLSYGRISSHFSHSRFHPILKIRRPHWGIDYAAPRGTPISALGSGRVTYAGWKGQYGRLVIIRHVKGYSTRYGHLSKIKKGVKNGSWVNQGEVIGYVGSTGLATGPHLHFEIRHHGKPINPLRIKVPKSPGLEKKYLGGFKGYVDSIQSIIKEIRHPADSVKSTEIEQANMS